MNPRILSRLASVAGDDAFVNPLLRLLPDAEEHVLNLPPDKAVVAAAVASQILSLCVDRLAREHRVLTDSHTKPMDSATEAE